MNEIKIKPYKTLSKGYLYIYIFPLIVIFMCFAILSNNLSDFYMSLLAMIGFIAVGVLVYIFARLFYRSYYVISEKEIVKFKKKKIVFKIKKEQIIELGYRKMSKLIWFLLPINYGDPLCEVLSIRYYSAEIESASSFDFMFKLHSLTDEEKAQGFKEYNECFTKKEINKICQILKLKTKNISLYHETRSEP